MIGVGRIHVAVNIPVFTSFVLTNVGSGSARISWTAIRGTSVTITGPTGTTLVSSGALSGTYDFPFAALIGYGVNGVVSGVVSDSAGGRGGASASLTIPAPISPTVTASVSAVGRAMTIVWSSTNSSSVTLYLCDSNYNVVTTLSTAGSSGSFVYTASSYNTMYYFRARATGVPGSSPSTADALVSGASGVTPANFTVNFGFTGGVQTWTVPAGLYLIRAICRGAASADVPTTNVPYYLQPYAYPGANGGYAEGSMAVTPGEVLTIQVGGREGYNNAAPHGGANGSSTWNGGTVGGGASGIYRADGTRLLVAGGGGGRGGEIYVNYASPFVVYASAGGAGGGARAYDGQNLFPGGSPETNADVLDWQYASVWSYGGAGGATWVSTNNAYGVSGGGATPAESGGSIAIITQYV